VIRRPFSKRADKALRALSADDQERAIKALQGFQENPRHPSLNFERLAGHDDLCSIRISRGHRAILRRVEGTADVYDLENVGPHDVYRRL
jgi:mRNA-degrading endonuclease RelE of RelBE toxin-antitoxin system